MQIPLVKNSFRHEFEVKKELAKFVLSANRFSMGDQCLGYEREYSQFQGCEFTTFFNSGSSANLALLQALINLGRLRPGDKIGFSALTWATNVMPIIQLGLQPIPVDIDLVTLNVSSINLEKVIKQHPDLKAFFATNVLGFCGDLDIIAEVCNSKNILFIEDNCESFGSQFKGKNLGNFGLASTCSSFVGHHLSTIEGGVVCTNDSDLSDALIIVRAHGWSRGLSGEKRLELQKTYDVDPFYSAYTFFELGYNLRPTEINGFIGRHQLKFAKEIISERAMNFHQFQDKAKKNPDILSLNLDYMDLISNFAFPLIFKDKQKFLLYKDRFIRASVEIRPIIGGNMTRQPFYQKYGGLSANLPNADLAHENGFYFPNHDSFNLKEIEHILNQLSHEV